jgi:dTDP-4-dehydrorhamnose reductase
MKMAIFGKSGQLGRALQQKIPSDIDAVFYDRHDCNLLDDPKKIEKFVSEIPKVDVVVLAAAYTGVNEAEIDIDDAFQVNSLAPAIIARVCRERDMSLIYISTDYVFDGLTQSPYLPSDMTNPLNIYGKSKRAGEVAICESGCPAVILRTSWIFDGSGKNFMTTILKLTESKNEIRAINDQIGRPTYAGHFAQSVIVAARHLFKNKPRSCEIFHVTNTGQPISWAGFAKAILDAVKLELPKSVSVQEIPSSAYESRADRPAYSVLDVTGFENRFGFTLPDWRDGLELALTKWRELKR